jgi:hypothetical protein
MSRFALNGGCRTRIYGAEPIGRNLAASGGIIEMWTYSQSTGLLEDAAGNPVAAGGAYAGNGPGRNNPAWQHVRNIGPLPRGLYKIAPAVTHAKLGPVCLPLTPDAGNVMHGRSAFYIHGDNATNDASEGCIILARPIRELLSKSKDRWLVVVKGPDVEERKP